MGLLQRWGQWAIKQERLVSKRPAEYPDLLAEFSVLITWDPIKKKKKKKKDWIKRLINKLAG